MLPGPASPLLRCPACHQGRLPHFCAALVLLVGWATLWAGSALRLAWDDRRLLYAVREPFRSRHSEASLVAGLLEPGAELRLESRMAQHGVIFSDGMEEDYLSFDAGAIATVRATEAVALLAAPEARP